MVLGVKVSRQQHFLGIERALKSSLDIGPEMQYLGLEC